MFGLCIKKDLFTPFVKQFDNLFDIDLGKAQLGRYTIIGYGQNNSAPEVPQYKIQRKGLTKRDLVKRKKKYNEYLKALDKLFKSENPDEVIFISHNVPFRTKLDKITSPQAPKSVQGKHFGSLVARKVVEKYQPLVMVGGHIHEGQGIQKIGSTYCINDGSGAEGRYAVIELGKRINISTK